MLSILVITRQSTTGQVRTGVDVSVSCSWELDDIAGHLRNHRTDAILFETTFAQTEEVMSLEPADGCAVYFYDRWRRVITSRENDSLAVPGLIHRWGPEIWGELARWIGRRQRRSQDGEIPAWRNLIVGEGRAILDVIRVIQTVARRQSTVLITGETGTGKECAAKAIHMLSDRRTKSMVSVNCACLPESLLEAELFGHAKGAFTGAVGSRAGYFEKANNSTLFFDEIGDISANTQVKLLRVLQEREIIRLGSSDRIPVDIRLICATNRDLNEAVQNKSFRQDLFYRLNVLPLRMPPLRERLEDLPLLVHHFLEKICRRECLPNKNIAPDVLDWLADYDWPGNIRELENAVEMAVTMSGERNRLQRSDFALNREGSRVTRHNVDLPENGIHYESFMSNLQRALIEKAIQRTNGNQSAAAHLLGMKRTTLISKCRALGSCA